MMHKLLSNQRVYRIVFITFIMIYFIVEFYFIFIYEDLIPKFKVFETHYELIGDVDNKVRYEQAFNYSNLLYSSRSIIYLIVSSSILTIFKRHQTIEKFKYDPSIINDYRIDAKLSDISYLQMFIFTLIIFNLNSDLSQMNSWPIVKHIDFELPKIVTNKLILLIIVTILQAIIWEFISRFITNNVKKRIKVIEKGDSNDLNEQVVNQRTDIRHLDNEDSFISHNNNSMSFLNSLKLILFVVCIFLLISTIVRFYDYHVVNVPKQININKNFTLYDDHSKKNEELCEIWFSTTLHCRIPYDYEDAFKQYKLTQIKLTIENQKIIDQLEQGSVYLEFSQFDNYDDLRLDSNRLNITDSIVIIDLSDLSVEQVGSLYLSLEPSDTFSELKEPVIKDYLVTFEKID